MKVTEHDKRGIQEFAIRKNCSYEKAFEIMKKAHNNPKRATKLLLEERELKREIKEIGFMNLLVDVTKCDEKTAKKALIKAKMHTYNAYKLILKWELLRSTKKK